jgi:hypothetical protein
MIGRLHAIDKASHWRLDELRRSVMAPANISAVFRVLASRALKEADHGHPVYFITGNPAIKENAGTFTVSFPSGSETIPVALSPHQFLFLCQMGRRQFGEWEALHLETIHSFPADRHLVEA